MMHQEDIVRLRNGIPVKVITMCLEAEVQRNILREQKHQKRMRLAFYTIAMLVITLCAMLWRAL